MSASLRADAIEEAQAALRGHERVLARGGGTKPALSSPPEGTVTLDVSGLTGIEDYDPEELTFTARAGTPLGEIEDALAEKILFGEVRPGQIVLVGTEGEGEETTFTFAGEQKAELPDLPPVEEPAGTQE